MSEHQGRHAGNEARRVGSLFEPPDLDRTVRRHRRAKALGVVATVAAVVIVAVGASGLLTRTVSESIPAATTTTIAVPTTTVGPATTAAVATSTTQAAIATEPIHGGTVRVAASIDLIGGYTDVDGSYVPPTMNPLFESLVGSDLTRLTVPGAFRVDAGSGELGPWVLSEIPSIANGGVVVGDSIEVNYRIRPEAVWADGTPITAADLVFTHELIMDDELPISDELRETHGLVRPGSLIADGKTLRLELVRPDAGYERLYQWIVPAHAVDAATFADDWNERMWLSGGPFEFVSYEETTNSATTPGTVYFSRNDNYWETDQATGAQLPYLDAIEFQVFTPGVVNLTSLLTWIRTGEADLMLEGLGRWERSQLGSTDGLAVIESWDTLYEVMAFQLADSRLEVNPDSLNDQLLYRRAVLAAIDRTAVAEALGGPAVSSILGTSAPALDHDVWGAYDDPADTADLLAALGTELGRDFATDPPTAVYVSSYADETIAIGEAVAAELSARGIETTTDFDGDFFGTQLPEGLTDLLAFRLFAPAGSAGLLRAFEFMDPLRPDDERLFDWAELGAPAQRYSEILAEARSTLDRDLIVELLAEAESILADQAVVYPLVRRQMSLHPYWPERIQGFVPNRHYGWGTATAAWWWSPQG